MTLKTIIKITADGNLELPPEIRSRLQSGDEFFLWEEKDTIILKRANNSLVDSIKQQEKIKGDDRFFEIADRLAELNEVDPITEEEIQEEIRAYRREKRALPNRRCPHKAKTTQQSSKESSRSIPSFATPKKKANRALRSLQTLVAIAKRDSSI